MWASLGSLGDGVVFDTPVTSPVKSPKKRPAEFPLPPVETETQAAQSSMLTPSAFGQLYSTTLLVLIVAATASIATNRISEVLFVMLGLYLLWRGLLSSFLPNLLAPGPGTFGWLARKLLRRINYPTIDSAVELLAPSDGETVIEIGSGDGRGVHSILRRCTPGQLHAVEWHETYIQELRADPLLREKKVQLHECDARSLPVPDGSADKVLAVNCVYFLEPLDEYFRELYRVLKPGGSLLVAAKFHLVKGVHDPWAYSHSNPFIHTEAATVAAAMRAAGFKASNAAAPRAAPQLHCKPHRPRCHRRR